MGVTLLVLERSKPPSLFGQEAFTVRSLQSIDETVSGRPETALNGSCKVGEAEKVSEGYSDISERPFLDLKRLPRIPGRFSGAE